MSYRIRTINDWVIGGYYYDPHPSEECFCQFDETIEIKTAFVKIYSSEQDLELNVCRDFINWLNDVIKSGWIESWGECGENPLSMQAVPCKDGDFYVESNIYSLCCEDKQILLQNIDPVMTFSEMLNCLDIEQEKLFVIDKML